MGKCSSITKRNQVLCCLWCLERISSSPIGRKQQRDNDFLDTVWKVSVQKFADGLCCKSRHFYRSIQKSCRSRDRWESSNWRLSDLQIWSEAVRGSVRKILWSLWEVGSYTERQESSSQTKSHFCWIWTRRRRIPTWSSANWSIECISISNESNGRLFVHGASKPNDKLFNGNCRSHALVQGSVEEGNIIHLDWCSSKSFWKSWRKIVWF